MRVAPRAVPVVAAIVCVGAVVAWSVGGAEAALGWALGLAATASSLIGNWLITRLCGNLARQGARPASGSFMTVLGLLLKLPLYGLLGLWVVTLGTSGLVFFLIGLGLVYLGLVGWALAQS